MNIAQEDLEPLTQESWKSPWDFIINNVGCVVGNISFLMFPQSCYDHGGVAFMIMYIIVTLLIALPMFYVECLIGTYVCRNPIFIYRNICPIASGVGYAIMYVAILDYVPECIFMTWSIYYFFTSMTPTLPWDTCGNTWNRASCFTEKRDEACQADIPGSIYYGKTCMKLEDFCDLWNYTAINVTESKNLTMFCVNQALPVNDSGRLIPVENVTERTSPASDYFIYRVSNMPDDLQWHGIGFLGWGLVFCYTTTWMIIFLAKRGGIKTSVPAWYVATSLSLSSQGVASGILTTLASFHNSEAIRLRCRIFAIGTNLVSNLFFVMVVFSFAGARAHLINVSLHDIFSKRENIIYISYTEVLRENDVAQLFGIVFFAALSAIGMDVQGGYFILTLFVELVPSGLFILTLYEIAVLVWLYGYPDSYRTKFFTLRTTGSGSESVFFKIIVVYCLPIVLPILLIYSLVDFKPMKRYGKVFPIGFEIARVLLFLVPIVIVFTIAAYKCIMAIRREESIRDLFKPTPEWISLEKRMQVLQEVKDVE